MGFGFRIHGGFVRFWGLVNGFWGSLDFRVWGSSLGCRPKALDVFVAWPLPRVVGSKNRAEPGLADISLKNKRHSAQVASF